MDWSFFADQLLNPTDKFVRAFFLVICMSLISMFFGVILGIIFALLRLSKSILIQTFSFLYIWIFRSVPVMVWFVLFYTGFAIADIYRFQDLNLFGFIIRGNVQAAIICLSMREAAYMAEVIRGGILSVEQGQVDASKVLGMSWWQTMYRIVLPQSLRVVVPPMGNNFNIMLKTTALASVIGVEELFLTTRTISAATFKVFEMFLILAIAYLIITMGWSMFQLVMEYRLKRHEQDPDKTLFQKFKINFRIDNNPHRDGS
jgi:polar amino acid transport system permease protein